MNLQELLNKLTPEEQQFVMDHFVEYITGLRQPQDIVYRRTATLFTLGTEEEIEQEAAQTLKLHIEQIRKQGLAAKLIALRKQHDRFQSIIIPYKDYLLGQKARADKFEELYDLGKYLVSLDTGYYIDIPPSKMVMPDFIYLQ